MKQTFTLANLRRFLKEKGYEVSSYGDDRPDLAQMRKIPKVAATLPSPKFWVVVKSDSDDLLKFTTKLMEQTWEVFERGQMVFNGEHRDDKVVVRIEQKEP